MGCGSEDDNGDDSGDADGGDQHLRDPTVLSATRNIVVGGGSGKDDDNDGGGADHDGKYPRLTGPASLSAVNVCRRCLYRRRC